MSSGRALRLHFSVVDKWGQRVDILRHPEMAGQEELVKQAISERQTIFRPPMYNLSTASCLAPSGYPNGAGVPSLARGIGTTPGQVVVTVDNIVKGAGRQ